MDALFLLSPSLFSIILFLILFQVRSAQVDSHYSSCAPFHCGNLENLSYPFWTDYLGRPAYCGYGSEAYKLKCIQNQPPVITINSQEFLLLHLNHSRGFNWMTIQRLEFGESTTCPQQILIDGVFNYSDTAENITLFYDCEGWGSANHDLTCKKNGRQTYALFSANHEDYSGGECNDRVEIPVEKMAWNELILHPNTTLNKTLVEPFDMKYFAYDGYCPQCQESGGRCGSNTTSAAAFACYCRDRPHLFKCEHAHSCSNCKRSGGRCGFDDTNEFVCFCSDGSHPKTCNDGRRLNLGTKLAIGFGAAIGGVIISSIVFYCWQRRRQGKVVFRSSYASGKSSSGRSFMKDPEKGDSIAGVHLFTYDELLKATNNFDSERELGDGGFGTVYYGKLEDGRCVAVKRLYENNYKRVEQFMNEVEMLTRLRHKNLVALYGCTSRHSRELLLVYEYVPSGTVADHLHGHRAKPGALPWSIRLEIAIETADALRYLHASDTIHRDVKTNNILLDNNFSVKVADFGLSRLFPTDVTHVSTAPQGTPGYVDPEYHQCYQLTDKSDVFSFGVVLIELISSKPAVDITRHRHEINLSNMAINKIQNRALHELVDPSLGFESDYKVRKMITGVAEVAFQCLQNEKDMRPTMAEVLEALMGIHNEDYSKAKAEEMDISADEVGLLKSGPLPHSPDSVMIKWVSDSSITPSVSS